MSSSTPVQSEHYQRPTTISLRGVLVLAIGAWLMTGCANDQSEFDRAKKELGPAIQALNKIDARIRGVYPRTLAEIKNPNRDAYKDSFKSTMIDCGAVKEKVAVLKKKVSTFKPKSDGAKASLAAFEAKVEELYRLNHEEDSTALFKGYSGVQMHSGGNHLPCGLRDGRLAPSTGCLILCKLKLYELRETSTALANAASNAGVKEFPRIGD